MIQESQAIIQTGGKQYRVQPGDIIEIEKIGGEVGESLSFDQVLFWQKNGETKIGQPRVLDCVVKGELVAEVKGPKVIAYKYKRRKNYRRKKGHRQTLHKVKITSIE